jgi:hypothetical protein
LPGQAEKIAELEPLIEGAEVLGWHWKGPEWMGGFLVIKEGIHSLNRHIYKYVWTSVLYKDIWLNINFYPWKYPKCFGVWGKSAPVWFWRWLLYETAISNLIRRHHEHMWWSRRCSEF